MRDIISIRHSGDLSRTKNFLTRAQRAQFQSLLEEYGQRGIECLSAMTPKKTGYTASSWYYVISGNINSFKIEWFNSNKESYVPVVIWIQYGHGNGHGGYVPGFDFINPAMKPVFDELAEALWMEVKGI